MRDVLPLGEIDAPAPAAGEGPVRAHASGVNLSDTKSWGGVKLALEL